MLAKYINEHKIKIKRNGEILYIDDKQIINPKEEDYIKAGYKELIQDIEPEYNEETEYLEVTYEIGFDDKIHEHYKVIPIETQQYE